MGNQSNKVKKAIEKRNYSNKKTTN